MTRRQLEDTIRRAYIFHGFRSNVDVEVAEADYYSTLADIRERLEKEVKNG